MMPATPLPWGHYKDIVSLDRGHSDDDYYLYCVEPDAAYIVHAANAYPKLVKALRQIAKPALGGKAQQYAAQAILRELGELE
jgi:hypothetical protein